MNTFTKQLTACGITAAVAFACAIAATAQVAETDRRGGGGGGGGQIAYSGRAVVVDATVLGTQTLISDTGQLPSTGGSLHNSVLDVSVPDLLTAQVAHASTVAHGDHSRSQASVASLNMTVGGHTITADFVSARAAAVCSRNGASSTGGSELLNFSVDGQAVSVTTEPNQMITLPGVGYVVINEQVRSGSGNASDLTVNALHVYADGIADVVIASAHADITCGSFSCSGGDFVTGGGWIPVAGRSRGTFAVAGGIRNGAFWGHLTYVDHGSGLRVRGTEVTAYSTAGATARHIEGRAEVNGQSGFTYQVDVADNGEPGRADNFVLRLSNGYTAGGNLSGGNTQLHRPCK